MSAAAAQAKPAQRRIGISLGNIGDLNHGLGEFALQIGTRIAAAAPLWRQQFGVQIDFHLMPKFSGLFGSDVGYLEVNRWHRTRHVQPLPYALWHSLHQLNKNKAPIGTGHRLLTVHDLNYLYGRNAFSKWRHQRRTMALMRRTDEVVAISRHTAADVQQHLSWAGPMQVIYNGARSFLTAAREPLPGWSAQPQASQPPFLFHLSRMSASKNPQAIIELARVWPEMMFVLCGPPSDDAKQLRDSTQLPNLQFHLGIDDTHKAWAYAHCSGFLFPSLAEGFGLPPIEAMHFGKPAFLARRTCLPEIGGEAADYFDDFEPTHMKAVVQAGLVRQAMPGRAAAIQAHAAQFDWDHAAAAYLALYARLLKLPTPASASAAPQ